jgi:hypothetical protein
MQSKEEDEFGKNDSHPLKIDGLPGVIVQVVNHQHRRVCIICYPGEKPLEGREEGGVV